MVFSSSIFLFLFLPVVLIGNFLAKKQYRNYLLLFFSLIFYAWGEPIYVLLMLAVIVINYIMAILIDKRYSSTQRKVLLFFAIVMNISILGYFKYADFIVDNINLLLQLTIDRPSVTLPIGISFFIFQSISYIVDVYRKEVAVQKNIIILGLYISIFPQLIAGPIVRYQHIARELAERHISAESFATGVRQFMAGFIKKLIIADQLAPFVSSVFEIDGGSMLLAWLGAIAYTLQIYYDFSGYSDMAIGMGRMLGFTFPQNFNYPYISSSIKEFWRRWHISLSSWFRDYVYIPLGGNRKGRIRTYANLWTVFFLTGLWHGASWNFVIWGLYHGVFLILERIGLEKILQRLPRTLQHFYLLAVVIIGWVFFNASDISHALAYISNMFSISEYEYKNLLIYVNSYSLTWLLLGMLFSTPVCQYLKFRYADDSNVHDFARIMVFLLAICCLFSNGFSPFLYFRF